MNHSAIVTLASLTLASCNRYPDAAGHLIRTSCIGARLAKLMGLDGTEQEHIRLATPVHDIGKLAIPDDVLLKPGKLDQEERRIMERHSSIGADLLAGSSDELMQFAAQVARYHHERFDGSGYPSGLSGESIPLAARIVAVADAFDAMTEPRCYRPRMTDDDALSIISAGSGRHFDPFVVKTFLSGFSLVNHARLGANEQLSLGNEVAVVAKFYGLTHMALRRLPRPTERLAN